MARGAEQALAARPGIASRIAENPGAHGQQVSVTIGARKFQDIKHAAANRAVSYFSSTALHASAYATGAMDVADTIAGRMRRLSRVEYEALLRPAFRQDEWKLITVGAMIGALVGELQVLLLLG